MMVYVRRMWHWWLDRLWILRASLLPQRERMRLLRPPVEGAAAHSPPVLFRQWAMGPSPAQSWQSAWRNELSRRDALARRHPEDPVHREALESVRRRYRALFGAE